jgi:hypothetical protein
MAGPLALHVRPLEGVQWRRRRDCRTQKEEAMKYSTSHRNQGSGRSRSSTSALSPYLIEDIALTPSDLERMGGSDVTIVALR